MQQVKLTPYDVELIEKGLSPKKNVVREVIVKNENGRVVVIQSERRKVTA